MSTRTAPRVLGTPAEFGDVNRALLPLWEREQAFREKLAGPAGSSASQSFAARAISNVAGFLRLQSLEREPLQPAFLEFLRALELPDDLASA